MSSAEDSNGSSQIDNSAGELVVEHDSVGESSFETNGSGLLAKGGSYSSTRILPGLLGGRRVGSGPLCYLFNYVHGRSEASHSLLTGQHSRCLSDIADDFYRIGEGKCCLLIIARSN